MHIKEAVKAGFAKAVKHTKPADAKTVLHNRKKIRRRASKGLLKNLVDDVDRFISMIRDWWSGDYTSVPWWTIAAILTALLWLLNPWDLIPDILPLIGLLDDLLVLTMVMAMVEQDMRNYDQWRKEHGKDEEEVDDDDCETQATMAADVSETGSGGADMDGINGGAEPETGSSHSETVREQPVGGRSEDAGPQEPVVSSSVEPKQENQTTTGVQVNEQ